MSHSGASQDSRFSLRITSSDSGLTMSDNIDDYHVMKDVASNIPQTPQQGAHMLEQWYQSPEPRAAWTQGSMTGSPWQLAGASPSAASVSLQGSASPGAPVTQIQPFTPMSSAPPSAHSGSGLVQVYNLSPRSLPLATIPRGRPSRTTSGVSSKTTSRNTSAKSTRTNKSSQSEVTELRRRLRLAESQSTHLAGVASQNERAWDYQSNP